MKRTLQQAIEHALGDVLVETRSVTGGDINAAFSVRTSRGGQYFVKSHDAPPPRFFELEAEGLAWLRESRTLRVPELIAFSNGGDHGAAFLALEWIASARRSPTHDVHLGHGLARMHKCGPLDFGMDTANYIGRLPQPNGRHVTWAEFYGAERLMPQCEMAARANLLPSALQDDLETLALKLPELVGPDEAPARLHGDLWGGNAITDENGEPCLIDPAAYGGHREVDLAMMRLFGGFSPAVFRAYEDIYPLTPGSAERIDLYQLYYLLVHLNLFGRGYLGAVKNAVSTYV